MDTRKLGHLSGSFGPADSSLIPFDRLADTDVDIDAVVQEDVTSAEPRHGEREVGGHADRSGRGVGSRRVDVPDDREVGPRYFDIAVGARGGDHLRNRGVETGDLAGTREGLRVGGVLLEGVARKVRVRHIGDFLDYTGIIADRVIDAACRIERAGVAGQGTAGETEADASLAVEVVTIAVLIRVDGAVPTIGGHLILTELVTAVPVDEIVVIALLGTFPDAIAADRLSGAAARVERAGRAGERSRAEPEALAGRSSEVDAVALFRAFDLAVAADEVRAGRGVVGAARGAAGESAAVVAEADAGLTVQVETVALFTVVDRTISARQGDARGGVEGAGAGTGQRSGVEPEVYAVGRIEVRPVAVLAGVDAAVPAVHLAPGGVESAGGGASERAGVKPEGLTGGTVVVGAVALLGSFDRAVAAVHSASGGVEVGATGVASEGSVVVTEIVARGTIEVRAVANVGTVGDVVTADGSGRRVPVDGPGAKGAQRGVRTGSTREIPSAQADIGSSSTDRVPGVAVDRNRTTRSAAFDNRSIRSSDRDQVCFGPERSAQSEVGPVSLHVSGLVRESLPQGGGVVEGERCGVNSKLPVNVELSVAGDNGNQIVSSVSSDRIGRRGLTGRHDSADVAATVVENVNRIPDLGQGVRSGSGSDVHVTGAIQADLLDQATRDHISVRAEHESATSNHTDVDAAGTRSRDVVDPDVIARHPDHDDVPLGNRENPLSRGGTGGDGAARGPVAVESVDRAGVHHVEATAGRSRAVGVDGRTSGRVVGKENQSHGHNGRK